MQEKIFLLPGFGEDGFVFNELLPYLNTHKKEIIKIDYRPVLDKFTFPFITVQQFSNKLIKYYNINSNDKLIGHSMGGYFSFQIRELIGTDIIMIGSFNDPKKIIHILPQFPRFTLFTTITGIAKQSWVKKYLLSKIKNEQIKAIQSKIMDNFNNFTNNELALMLEMNYQQKIKTNLPNPIRIHDKNDKIVSPPDEPYHQIKGGHFSLNIHPEEVYTIIKTIL